MEHLFIEIVESLVKIANAIGVLMIVIALVQSLYRFMKIHKFNFKKAHHDTTLGAGLTYALSILMIAEIVETVLEPSLNSIVVIAALVLVRFMFVLIITFENKQAEHHEKKENE